MYVYVYVCTFTHVYVDSAMRHGLISPDEPGCVRLIYIYTYLFIYLCVYLLIYVCVRVYVYLYVYVYTCIHLCIDFAMRHGLISPDEAG